MKGIVPNLSVLSYEKTSTKITTMKKKDNGNLSDIKTYRVIS